MNNDNRDEDREVLSRYDSQTLDGDSSKKSPKPKSTNRNRGSHHHNRERTKPNVIRRGVEGVKRMKNRMSLLSMFYGCTVFWFIVVFFVALIMMIVATPGQVYPGETMCPMQSAFQYNFGNSTLLYCANSMYISNLTILDPASAVMALVYEGTNNKPTLSDAYTQYFTYSFNWIYNQRIGDDTYYWALPLNHNSTLTVVAELAAPIEFQLYYDYHQLYNKKYELEDGATTISINFTHIAEEDGVYFIYFEMGRNAINNGSVTFSAVQTNYDPYSANFSSSAICAFNLAPGATAPPCSYNLTWGNDICVLLMEPFPIPQLFPNYDCILFLTEAWPQRWAKIGFGTILGAFAIVMLIHFVVNFFYGRSQKAARAQRLGTAEKEPLLSPQ